MGLIEDDIKKCSALNCLLSPVLIVVNPVPIVCFVFHWLGKAWGFAQAAKDRLKTYVPVFETTLDEVEDNWRKTLILQQAKEFIDGFFRASNK